MRAAHGARASRAASAGFADSLPRNPRAPRQSTARCPVRRCSHLFCCSERRPRRSPCNPGARCWAGEAPPGGGTSDAPACVSARACAREHCAVRIAHCNCMHTKPAGMPATAQSWSAGRPRATEGENEAGAGRAATRAEANAPQRAQTARRRGGWTPPESRVCARFVWRCGRPLQRAGWSCCRAPRRAPCGRRWGCGHPRRSAQRVASVGATAGCRRLNAPRQGTHGGAPWLGRGGAGGNVRCATTEWARPTSEICSQAHPGGHTWPAPPPERPARPRRSSATILSNFCLTTRAGEH